ncbi:MAG TPA: glycosyltransferase, partial [Adhaeribacter sp.]|nr:glycosyltransferase [Adhaeribacter sp.]
EHWTIYLPQNAHKMGWLRKKLTRRVINKADAVHTVSENLKQAMERLGFTNSHYAVIPNVADTLTFYPEYPSILASKTRFLHVAAFNEEAKNLSGLLRSIKKLSESRTDFELRIIGFGPAEKQLKKLAQELGLLNTFVFFEGKKETPEVAEYMRRSDVFVLFSNYENLPCVLIEALASGLPVIATKVGGVAEMIGKKQGILVEPRDEVALLKALQHMQDHHQDFPKAALREYAEARFSYQAVGKAFARLYEEVLHKTVRKL